jgi:hypothetical protein
MTISRPPRSVYICVYECLPFKLILLFFFFTGSQVLLCSFVLSLPLFVFVFTFVFLSYFI